MAFEWSSISRGIGAPGDPETPTGDGSIIGLLKRLRTLQAGGGGTPGGATEVTLVAVKADTAHLDANVSTLLTDAQLRASPVPVTGTVGVSGTIPVSGTFYPATQPISAVTLPLPTGAATEASVSALAHDGAPITGQTLESGGSAVLGWLASIRKAVTDRLPAALVNGRLDVNLGASTTIPVSGTFWQATQPVSGPLTDAQMRASAVPVSGAFFQATQPVSGPVTDTQLRASAVPVSGTFFQATQPVSAAALPLPTGAATEATLAAKLVTPTAKGVQAATATPTQDLKDSGRVLKTYTVSGLAGATTEALIALTPYADLVAGGAATSFAVTAGKRLRIQSIQVTWRNNTAVAGGVTVRLRLLAGTVLVGSPVHCTINASTSLATVGSGQSAGVTFPDGLELSGTMQFGLTQIAVGAVVGLDVQVLAYEY